jgi:DNA-binding transcriptional LysR family regulator
VRDEEVDPVNFTHLRAFHAVASEGSFTRAAQILNVSQPTLSSQVKSIEEAYGLRLLDRRHRKIVPSDTGRRVLEICREIFRLQDELEAVLDQNQKLQAGSLKVGADGPRPHHAGDRRVHAPASEGRGSR